MTTTTKTTEHEIIDACHQCNLDPDTFITVNFVRPSSKIRRFDILDAERTLHSLMNSFSKKHYPHRYRRHKHVIDYIAAIEINQRAHAHILLRRPHDMSAFKFEHEFRSHCATNQFIAMKQKYRPSTASPNATTFSVLKQRNDLYQMPRSNDDMFLNRSIDIAHCDGNKRFYSYINKYINDRDSESKYQLIFEVRNPQSRQAPYFGHLKHNHGYHYTECRTA